MEERDARVAASFKRPSLPTSVSSASSGNKGADCCGVSSLYSRSVVRNWRSSFVAAATWLAAPCLAPRGSPLPGAAEAETFGLCVDCCRCERLRCSEPSIDWQRGSERARSLRVKRVSSARALCQPRHSRFF